jgi:Variant SH3 domain
MAFPKWAKMRYNKEEDMGAYQLGFKLGDIVKVNSECPTGGGWFVGELNGKTGYVCSEHFDFVNAPGAGNASPASVLRPPPPLCMCVSCVSCGAFSTSIFFTQKKKNKKQKKKKQKKKNKKSEKKKLTFFS